MMKWIAVLLAYCPSVLWAYSFHSSSIRTRFGHISAPTNRKNLDPTTCFKNNPGIGRRSSASTHLCSSSSPSSSSSTTTTTTTTTSPTTGGRATTPRTTNGASGELIPVEEEEFIQLPRHSFNERVNQVLSDTEILLQTAYTNTQKNYNNNIEMGSKSKEETTMSSINNDNHPIYANSYVDLGKVEVVGFDYDYTLVTYTSELLELIYEMALHRLVTDRQYPEEMLSSGLQFDPYFSIRGLAVDKETGWICHLSYTHKVSVAWEGRDKVPTSRIYEEYRGKRALRPTDRRQRLKPLNDLFSMAECCLIADTIQFFKDNDIDFCPQNAVTDILSTIGETHMSGDFHRIVAAHPEKYFEPLPHLKQVLKNLKDAGKHLLFVSNSPFWYVDAGMKYIIGPNWRGMWDVVVTSAGKPNFYTDDSRPFREINQKTGRVKFQKVESFEAGEVYTEGCLRELIRLMKWDDTKLATSTAKPLSVNNNDNEISLQQGSLSLDSGAEKLATSSVLYIGDSLFADLVDAKREYGWTTAAVTPEVGWEMDMLQQPEYVLARRAINLLLNALRVTQEELGATRRTSEDIRILDQMEKLVSKWRDRETSVLGNPFGSVFSARYQPSLFAHSLRRYCDLYMSSVSSLRHYSPQHRFYPEQDARLLAHEIRREVMEPEEYCWELDDAIDEMDNEMK